jgi:hypothetical protein
LHPTETDLEDFKVTPVVGGRDTMLTPPKRRRIFSQLYTGGFIISLALISPTTLYIRLRREKTKILFLATDDIIVRLSEVIVKL